MAKADVRTRRFRNAEEQAIEATITSPVPVHAVMFRLRAVIGDLVLEGRVQLRAAARDTYEDGIRRGRTSVLHEEVASGAVMNGRDDRIGRCPPSHAPSPGHAGMAGRSLA